MADFESSPRFELPSSTSLSVDLDSAQGSSYRGTQSFGVLTPNPALPVGHPGATGQKYFTIQRVNGNGGNGKADGIGGGHRHTLEDSDGVKKNSVQRFFLKEAKDNKKVMVGTFHLISKCFGITITVCKFCTSLTCQNCQSYLCKSFVEIFDIKELHPEIGKISEQVRPAKKVQRPRHLRHSSSIYVYLDLPQRIKNIWLQFLLVIVLLSPSPKNIPKTT